MTPTHPAVQLLLLSGLTIFWLIPLSSWLMLSGQRDRNANLWFMGTALYSLTVTLFIFGNALPTLVRDPLLSVLPFSSVLCMLESLRRELSNRPGPFRVYALAVATAAALPTILLVQGVDTDLSRALSLAWIASAEVVLIAVSERVRRQHQSRALWVVNAMFAAFVLSNLSRIVEWLMTGRLSTLLDFTLVSNVALVVNYLSVILYCYGYWGFVVEKKQRQLVQATEQTVMARESEKLAIAREHMAQDVLRERTELMGRLAMVGKHAQSGALSASIAHELNQPLAAIQLNIEEAQRMVQTGTLTPVLAHLLGRIEQDNQRAASIVRRVRQMFSQGQLRAESLQLDDVVRYVLEWMKPRLVAAEVQVQLTLDTAAPFHFAGGEMEHVLMNLIDNAIDAMRQTHGVPRRLDIRTWREAGEVLLSVSDTGPGVPPPLREKVFGLSETSKSHGMGVGLWLSRYIVERHGGRMLLGPAGPSGACFVIHLPDR